MAPPPRCCWADSSSDGVSCESFSSASGPRRSTPSNASAGRSPCPWQQTADYNIAAGTRNGVRLVVATVSKDCGMAFTDTKLRRMHRLTKLRLEAHGGPPQIIQLVKKHQPGSSEAEEEEEEISVPLWDSERVLGFRWRECRNVETGGSCYLDPWVLIADDAGSRRLEPLSGELTLPIPPFAPGEVNWVPPEAAEEDMHEKLDVRGLRTMQGQNCAHIVGAILGGGGQSDNSLHVGERLRWHIRRRTGATASFWLELIVIDVILYYSDVGFDYQQNTLFWKKKRYGYVILYSIGIVVSMCIEIRDMVRWFGKRSQEADWLFSRMPCCFTAPTSVLISVLLVGTQMHILAFVAFSMLFKYHHPLAYGAHMAETLEASVATAVMTNFLTSVGRDYNPNQKDGPNVTDSIFSLITSLATLSLGYVSYDKVDGSVLGLHGRLQGWGPDVLALWVIRLAEVTSRVFAFNIILESLSVADYGVGFAEKVAGIGGLILISVAAIFHPFVGLVEAFAGVLAHPGQLVEKSSVLPVWKSIALHACLTCVAAAAMFIACKSRGGYVSLRSLEKVCDGPHAVPLWVLAVWIVSTCIAVGGLSWHCWFPHPEPHPVLEAASVGGGALSLPCLEKQLGSSSSVALCALVEKSGKDVLLDLDGYYLSAERLKAAEPHYAQSAFRCLPLVVDLSAVQLEEEEWSDVAHLLGAAVEVKEAVFDGCFRQYTPRAISRILQVLVASRNLRKLHLRDCKAIQEEDWALLRDARWPNLEDVSFAGCFALDSVGVQPALQALCSSRSLCCLDLGRARAISEVGWATLRCARWPQLREAKFPCCDFGAAAQHVLRVLALSRELRSLDLRGACIPGDSWVALKDAQWPELRSANLADCFKRSSVGSAEAFHALCTSGQLTDLDLSGSNIPSEVWLSVPACQWPFLRNVCSPLGDVEKLRITLGIGVEVLASGRTADVEIQDSEEEDWEAAAMESGRELHRLIANDGSEEEPLFLPAVHAAGQAEPLLELNLSGCKNLPASTWAAFQNASIETVDISGCFQGHSSGASEALQSLATCSTLRQVNFNDCTHIGSGWLALSTAQLPSLQRASLARCFVEDGRGADGVLLALGRCSKLTEVDLEDCSEISSAQWSLVKEAQWPELRKANFSGCAKLSGVGAQLVLRLLCCCGKLEEIRFARCSRISFAWSVLQSSCWAVLRKVDLARCFQESGAGSEAALRALGACPTLEAVSLEGCTEIGSAWSTLDLVHWPELREASLVACFRGAGVGAEAAMRCLGRSSRLRELRLDLCNGLGAAAMALEKVRWLHLRTASLARCHGVSQQGAQAVLRALAACRELEEVHLGLGDVGSAWSELEGAWWPALRTADLSNCHGAPAEVALRALGRCSNLQEVSFDGCVEMGSAWSALEAVYWPELRQASLRNCFSESGVGAAAALRALGSCKKLERLNLEGCQRVGVAWSTLEVAEWPELQEANLAFCFNETLEGAEQALRALGRCSRLQVLHFRGNLMAPALDEALTSHCHTIL